MIPLKDIFYRVNKGVTLKNSYNNIAKKLFEHNILVNKGHNDFPPTTI